MSVIKNVATRLSFQVNTLKDKIRRLSYRLSHGYFSLNNVILFIAIILCLCWTWSAISSMSRNWELEKRLATRRSELSLLKLEVETLELENEYYETEEYQELAARHQQGKKLPGETVVALPANTNSAKNKHVAAIEEPTEDTRSNFDQWMAFLFGS